MVVIKDYDHMKTTDENKSDETNTSIVNYLSKP
jgi:hypothetical protein